MRYYNIYITLLFSLTCSFLSGQIILDEQVTDWKSSYIVEEEIGDQINGPDIERLWMHNDDKYLYIRIDLSQEINLQSDNSLSLFIDVDQNANTGFKKNGLGSEFSFYFGDRNGYVNVNGGSININHAEVGLVVSPTVSSKTFEITVERALGNNGVFISGSINVGLDNDIFNGDMLPDNSGGVNYTLNNDMLFTAPITSLDKSPDADFRLLSYNVLRDRLFENSARASYERIFRALVPDVIAFQEIYDHNSEQTKNIIEDFLPSENDETWYHDKVGNDIVLVSRYPILRGDYISGNGAFLIDVNGREVLIVNIHLPCCNNNVSRQEEIDDILQYVRKAKEGQLSFDLQENTPIFIVGDSNLVGPASQRNSLRDGDIINNGSNGPDFFPDWDDTSLEDLISSTTGTPASYTWYNPESSFFPGRLDYVMYTGSVIYNINDFSLFTEGLSQNELILYNLSKSDTENASDHFPLVSDWSFDELISSTTTPLNSEFIIFPNPFVNDINILSKVDHENIVTANLYKPSGQLIESIYSENHLHIKSNVGAGVFILKILDASGRIFISKVVRL